MFSANCKVDTVKERNRLITWGSEIWQGNAKIEDVKLGKLCEKDILADNFIWPSRIDYDLFGSLCDTVEGKAPTINENNMDELVHNQ